MKGGAGYIAFLWLKVCILPVMHIMCSLLPLRKRAYSNILKILPTKNENFQIKNSYILHISDQNIDCGYSLEPH